jgi:DNA-binding NtrC family response regulator
VFSEHEVEIVAQKKPLSETLARKSYDVVVLGDDLHSVSAIKSSDPRTEIIVLGRDEASTFEAIRSGGTAFFTRSVDPAHLRLTLESIAKLAEERKKTGELERQLAAKYTFHGAIGKNPRMLDIFNLIRRIALYYKSVLITGETGVGKEVIAEALHRASPVAGYPFVACNCGSLVDNLIESELFGHTRGAFTGAVSDKKGLFETAGKGAIFLDEIGELPASSQTHLLRVLESGEFRRVGSNQENKALCRVITATNKDLSIEIKNGYFREDLFYRISQFVIHVPPLRSRKDDIPLLSRFFLARFVEKTGKKVFGISMPAQAALLSYDWVGNVRELVNVIERAAILTTESFIRLDDLPSEIRQYQHLAQVGTLDDVIKNHIQSVLQQCGNNRTEAAEKLGLTRWALLRKIEKYGIS